jgi:hypothetical protein
VLDMPPDTITLQVDSTSQTRVVEDSLPITLPARTLVWNSDGVQILQQLGTFKQSAFAAEERPSLIYQAVSATISDLDESGMIQANRYRIQGDQESVVLRQGPRNLLRYILRTQGGRLDDRNRTWTSSKAFSATIAGEQRTVWLLETANQSMLVFEADDLLVQILAPDADVLEQRVLPVLAQLKWTDPAITP